MISITIMFIGTALIVPVTCVAIMIMEHMEKEERRREEEA